MSVLGACILHKSHATQCKRSGAERKAYLRVHQTERQAHGNGQQPDDGDFDGDARARLVAAESHRVAERQVAVDRYRAQVHYAGRAEQHVQADPQQTVLRLQWKIACGQIG